MTEHIITANPITTKGIIVDIGSSNCENTVSVTLMMVTKKDVLLIKECVRKSLFVFHTKEMNVFLRDSKDMYEFDDEGNLCVTFILHIEDTDYDKIVELLHRFIRKKYVVELDLYLWKMIVPPQGSRQPKITRFIWDLKKVQKVNVASLESLLPNVYDDANALAEEGLYEVYQHMMGKLDVAKSEIAERVEILDKARMIPYTYEEMVESQNKVDRLHNLVQEAHVHFEKKPSLKIFNTSLINIKNEMDIFFSNYNK